VRNPKPSRLRILIVEDHASTRLGIKQILREEFRRAVFGEAETGSQTLALLKAQPWELLILDISLPDRNGLDLLDEVAGLRPRLPVLVYSAHPEDQFAVPALRARAAGYLTKERAPEELTTAVRTVVAGGKYLSPALSDRLAHGLAADRTGFPHEKLSRREFQVFLLTASGKTGKSIASQLGLSQKTVSTYRRRILQKLRFDSTAGLTQYAVRHGLV
jgi:DNA-binding NarL/FixJ family response regulator